MQIPFSGDGEKGDWEGIRYVVFIRDVHRPQQSPKPSLEVIVCTSTHSRTRDAISTLDGSSVMVDVFTYDVEEDPLGVHCLSCTQTRNR